MTDRPQRLRDRLRTVSGAWPVAFIAAIVLAVVAAPVDALVVLTLALLAFTAAGCAAFIIAYPPYWPWRHDVYGRNLLLLCWWLLIWISVALLQLVVPMPFRLAIGMQLVALGGITTVVWDRVLLVPRARREVAAERAERAEQERG